MRSPIAERFSPKQLFTVQNVMLSTLSGTEIVVPAKTFDANLVYPESLLRLVQEAKLGPDAIFWFTLVTRDKDNVMYQTVLQATAAQVQPRTNKSRDGGVGLATWVARTMAPLSDDPTPAKVSKPVVVTENTFEPNRSPRREDVHDPVLRTRDHDHAAEPAGEVWPVPHLRIGRHVRLKY